MCVVCLCFGLMCVCLFVMLHELFLFVVHCVMMYVSLCVCLFALVCWCGCVLVLSVFVCVMCDWLCGVVLDGLGCFVAEFCCLPFCVRVFCL